MVVIDELGLVAEITFEGRTYLPGFLGDGNPNLRFSNSLIGTRETSISNGDLMYRYTLVFDSVSTGSYEFFGTDSTGSCTVNVDLTYSLSEEQVAGVPNVVVTNAIATNCSFFGDCVDQCPAEFDNSMPILSWPLADVAAGVVVDDTFGEGLDLVWVRLD